MSSKHGSKQGYGIIAISGLSGCGNTTVSRLLAERLGLRLVNYTFRTMAEERGIPFAEMLRLAESDDTCDRSLDSRQVELAREGDCVIGSRLAIWLLPDAALRLYLSASPETRARRIAKREGGSFEATLEATRARDSRDHERYRRIYGIDNGAAPPADLVVNTERFSPEAIVELVVAAMSGLGRE